MIKFIHTADIHFGMENYGKIDPKTGIHSRLLDFQKALNFCIDVALEKEVDFFLFSGDAYKTANPSPTQQRLLSQCFLRLHKEIVIFLASFLPYSKNNQTFTYFFVVFVYYGTFIIILVGYSL